MPIASKVILLKFYNQVLDGKTNSVKTIKYMDLKNLVCELFKDIRSLSFTLIKLKRFDPLNLKNFENGYTL